MRVAWTWTPSITESFARAASSAAPASVRIGTNVSSVTQDCASFARMTASATARADARLAIVPAGERICPGTMPTTPASVNVAISVPSRARMRPRVVFTRVMRTRRPAVREGRIAVGDQSIFQTPLSFSPMYTSESVVVRRTSPTRAVWKVTSSGTVA